MLFIEQVYKFGLQILFHKLYTMPQGIKGF